MCIYLAHALSIMHHCMLSDNLNSFTMCDTSSGERSIDYKELVTWSITFRDCHVGDLLVLIIIMPYFHHSQHSSPSFP